MIPAVIAPGSALCAPNAAFRGDRDRSWSPKEGIAEIPAREETPTAIPGRYSDELLGDPRPAAVLALLADRGYGPIRLAAVKLAMVLDQRTAASAPAVDKGDKPAVRAILNPPAPVKRGPSAEDHAYELGRSLGLELEGPTPTPGHYTESEGLAFQLGQDDASRELDRRADAMAETWSEEQRWSEEYGRHVDVFV